MSKPRLTKWAGHRRSTNYRAILDRISSEAGSFNQLVRASGKSGSRKSTAYEPPTAEEIRTSLFNIHNERLSVMRASEMN